MTTAVGPRATFDLAMLGLRVETPTMTLEPAAVAAYAAATNDDTRDVVAGRLAPPLYAFHAVLRPAVAAKQAVTSAFGVHGEQDISIHRPLEPGMRVRTAATVVGVRQRSTGVATIVNTETRLADGDALLNEQYFTYFAAGGSIARDIGTDAPRRDVAPADGAPRVERVYALDADQTRRFAAATDDWDAYTLDDEAARGYGFEGAIVHGPCTMAFAARAVVAIACGGDLARLRRLALRLARPLVLCGGQALTTRVWAAGVVDGITQFGFEAFDKRGRRMITQGLAEVGP